MTPVRSETPEAANQGGTSAYSTTGQRQIPAEDLAYLLVSLFATRTDAYAEQLPSGGYNAIREPLTLDIVLDHLAGSRTIGAYQVAPDGTAKACIFDLDIRKSVFEWEGLSPGLKLQLKEAASRIRAQAGALGLKVLWAFSGRKGVHVYILLGVSTPAKDVVELADIILHETGWTPDSPGGCKSSHENYPNISCERFPKQAEIEPGGLGSLIKLPLGKHQVSGHWSYFLSEGWRKIEDPLPLLEPCVPQVEDIIEGVTA